MNREQRKEWGVAIRFKGRKKWLLPTEYGTEDDAKEELDSLKDDTTIESALVWRFAASQWKAVEPGVKL
ncbi:hypothetical protein KITKAT_92 [Arthrobacter phage Kitkat]|uniref:Uncharacterized protein n=1 Tax=Arthrobacter phage Kitkat TaxID=1796996 RepID=A0A140G6R8_9CAUD|nr:hypothetical protein BJD77_gp092 [Arthrobacter phage Kitkat]AMM44353.1 hypothetical protein KITKAT_92 [Arthrobacter phage Kitkat]